MRKAWLLVAACVLAAGTTASLAGAGLARQGKKACECGAHPPGPPRDRSR